MLARLTVKNVWFRIALPIAAGALGLIVPLVALPMVLVVLFSWLTFPNGASRRLVTTTHVVACLLVTAAVGRFIVDTGIPGIVKKGQFKAEEAAVSQLRELLFAQEARQRHQHADPDGDGKGSFGLIEQLAGLAESPQVLDRRYQAMLETDLGPATRLGHYFYILCLPTRGGGWTTVAGDDIDFEAAETQFVGYAWPVSAEKGVSRTFFIDQDERILEHRERLTHLRHPKSEKPSVEPPAFVGPDRTPRCDEALTHPEQWFRWRGKESRLERRAKAQ